VHPHPLLLLTGVDVLRLQHAFQLSTCVSKLAHAPAFLLLLAVALLLQEPSPLLAGSALLLLLLLLAVPLPLQQMSLLAPSAVLLLLLQLLLLVAIALLLQISAVLAPSALLLLLAVGSPLQETLAWLAPCPALLLVLPSWLLLLPPSAWLLPAAAARVALAQHHRVALTQRLSAGALAPLTHPAHSASWHLPAAAHGNCEAASCVAPRRACPASSHASSAPAHAAAGMFQLCLLAQQRQCHLPRLAHAAAGVQTYGATTARGGQMVTECCNTAGHGVGWGGQGHAAAICKEARHAATPCVQPLTIAQAPHAGIQAAEAPGRGAVPVRVASQPLCKVRPHHGW
jgi:hypothetical protein